MAEEIRVDIDQAALRELYTNPDGPVWSAVNQVTEIVQGIAQGLAPVSVIGSKFSPPGNLKLLTRTSAEHHFGDDGMPLGLVGAPLMPYAPISNFRSLKGWTANARSARHPGRFTVRKASNDYLVTAIEIAPHIVLGSP
jgi:hypothetical protein